MQAPTALLYNTIRVARIFAFLFLSCFLWAACAAPASSPAVAPAGSGWKVARHLTYDTVHASLDRLSPLRPLSDSAFYDLYDGGYVTTDPNGQGVLRRDQCLAYVFQKSSWLFQDNTVTVNSCPKGSTGAECSVNATAFFKNCPIKVTSLPASVVMSGTRVTVAYQAEIETLLVLVHEGEASVTWAVDPGNPVQIAQGESAFFPTDATLEEASAIFNEPPGIVVDIPSLVPTMVDRLGLQPEFRRLNVELNADQIEIVPMPDPFSFILQPVNDPAFEPRVADALESGGNWGANVEQFSQDQSVIFETPDRVVSLNEQGFDPAFAQAVLAEAGYSEQLPVDLYYDPGIPGVDALLDAMRTDYSAASVRLNAIPLTDDSAAGMLATAPELDTPVLMLVSR